MRLRSVHAGVSEDEVRAQTGFALEMSSPALTTQPPTEEELRVLRTRVDLTGSLRR